MKKITAIILIIIGLLLIIGSMFAYDYIFSISKSEPTLKELLGFAITSPSGILGIILIIIGFYKMFTIKK